MKTHAMPTLPWGPGLALSAVLATTALLAAALPGPTTVNATAPRLDEAVPSAFGNWSPVAGAPAQVSALVEQPHGQASPAMPYDQVLTRSYQNTRGQQVMLTLAYAREQRAATRIHPPEDCYRGAGFRVGAKQPALFAQGDGAAGWDFLAERSGRREAVSYWIRIGDRQGLNGAASRWYLFTQGLRGRVPDGILVRASMLAPDAAALAAAQPVLHTFLGELVAGLPADTRALLMR